MATLFGTITSVCPSGSALAARRCRFMPPGAGAVLTMQGWRKDCGKPLAQVARHQVVGAPAAYGAMMRMVSTGTAAPALRRRAPGRTPARPSCDFEEARGFPCRRRCTW